VDCKFRLLGCFPFSQIDSRFWIPATAILILDSGCGLLPSRLLIAPLYTSNSGFWLRTAADLDCWLLPNDTKFQILDCGCGLLPYDVKLRLRILDCSPVLANFSILAADCSPMTSNCGFGLRLRIAPLWALQSRQILDYGCGLLIAPQWRQIAAANSGLLIASKSRQTDPI